MARRLHSDTLGGSRKWAALESHAHRMLYERAIDITDPYGRFDADPVMFRARAVPRLEISVEEVAAALNDMERVGLIERWEIDGNPYAKIVDFEVYNKPDPAKEAQTRIPDPDGVVPIKPGRTDRGKPTAKAKSRKKSSPTPKSGKPNGDSGQTQGRPRANPGQEVGALDEEYRVRERLSDGDSHSVPSPLTESTEGGRSNIPEPLNTRLGEVIEAWNAERGQLRRVAEVDAAKDAIRPHVEKFIKRRGWPKALELFRVGIAAVRDDPHWLGPKAAKPTRSGQPYGILNYARHLNEKIDAALAEAEEPAKDPPQRPWREYDIADHIPSGIVATLATINDDGTAITVNGETWNLSDCVRCNN